MGRLQLLFGVLCLYSLESTAENASIRWLEVGGRRSTVVNLGFGPGTFYIMNIKNMSDIAIEDGQTRVMDARDYETVSDKFGDYPFVQPFSAGHRSKFGKSEHTKENHAAHDRWFRRALKRLNAERAKMKSHMHDDMWK